MRCISVKRDLFPQKEYILLRETKYSGKNDPVHLLYLCCFIAKLKVGCFLNVKADKEKTRIEHNISPA